MTVVYLPASYAWMHQQSPVGHQVIRVSLRSRGFSLNEKAMFKINIKFIE